MGKAVTTTRAQESTNAIERLYITMRHLFNRGFYKPNGISGEALKNALLSLRPEIYGSVAENKAELNGLIYVLERLPEGIEQCRFINLTSDEGFGKSHIEPIIPPKRRRNCYRIDDEQMNIEITRGRSDIYDILTHLTFLFIESDKICKRVLIPDTENTIRDWSKLEMTINKKKITQEEREIALIHTANILGRSFENIVEVYTKFATKENPERFLKIIYWLGKLSIAEEITGEKRAVTFSALLRERLGHHIHGERWANNIKTALEKHKLLGRPIHIISANMHSVMNSLFARKALKKEFPDASPLEIYEALSSSGNTALREKVQQVAEQNGMISLYDTSGTNINVQIFDLTKLTDDACCYEFNEVTDAKKPVIFVMDYAFGEQAYETIDELLKPFVKSDVKVSYAYYASDNPLETGSTLASGGLGTTGVKPTYLITDRILKQIFNS